MALDNDVVLKLACYRLLDKLPGTVAAEPRSIYILGAARFVIRNAITRSRRIQDKQQAQGEVSQFINSVSVIEPDQREIELATELEELAITSGFDVDTGESQLLAVAANRLFALLVTGDKRAVLGIEQLLAVVASLAPVAGRVVILEQVISRMVHVLGSAQVCQLVCAEREVDKAVAICCSCHSPELVPNPAASLASYIGDLRSKAPRALVDGYESLP